MTLKQITDILKEKNLYNDIDIVKKYMMKGLLVVHQFHIYHLTTKNAQWHEAIGEFYTNLDDELDGFIEGVLAYYKIENLEDVYDTYQADIYFGCSIDRVSQELIQFKNDTTKIYDIVQSSENAGLMDKLADIQQLIDRLTYKLKLV